MTSLKLVVLPLDLHEFSSLHSNRITFSIFWNKFIDYSELLKLKGPKVLKNKIGLTLIDGVLGRHRFFINMATLIKQKVIGRRSVTDQKKKPDKPLDKDKIFRRVQLQLAGKNVFDKDLLHYFEKILNLCKEKNIPVVTLQCPLSRYYIEYAEEYVTVETMQRTILENKTFGELIYQNLNYAYFAIDNDLLFGDGDHLNSKGELIFSDYLDKDISRIIEEMDSTINKSDSVTPY
jgi:hypothetical protein